MNIGGIKHILLYQWNEEKIKSAQYLFIKFGASALWLENKKSILPVYAYDSVALTDFKIKALAAPKELFWSVDQPNNSYIFSSFIGVIDSSIQTLVEFNPNNAAYFLPSWLQGKLENFLEISEEKLNQSTVLTKAPKSWPYFSSDAITVVSQPKDTELNFFLEQLENKKFIYYYDSDSNSISFYDDHEFHSNDLEIITAETRKQLEETFNSLNYTRVPGGIYKKNETQFEFAATQKSYSYNLTDFSQLMQADSHRIITPTQQAALIVENGLDIKAKLIKLANTVPFNILKLQQYLKQNEEKQFFSVLKEVNEHLEKILLFYKEHKPKGSIGKKNKKDKLTCLRKVL